MASPKTGRGINSVTLINFTYYTQRHEGGDLSGEPEMFQQAQLFTDLYTDDYVLLLITFIFTVWLVLPPVSC